MRYLIGCLFLLIGSCSHAAGTIDLPPGPYCATTVTAGVYNGVTAGTCSITPPGSCPPGRALTTVLAHSYEGIGAKSVDVTKADNIFGTFTAWTPANGFPWDQGYTVFVAVKRAEYIAAEFVVPLTTPASQRGFITKGATIPGPQNTIAISRNCGSFVPDPGTQFCVAKTASPGAIALAYRVPTAQSAACVLTPGQRYYLNIKLSDPLAVDPFCTATTCKFTLQNNHNP